MHVISETVSIDSAVYRALADFNLPTELAFGNVMAPIMYRADCINGQWHSRRLIPYGPIAIDPACKVLHYGQEVFEGMKSYAVGGNKPSLFRPQENWQRLNRSAKRLIMPSIPEDIFMEAVSMMTAFCHEIIPSDTGCALYLRPFMLGMDASLNLGESDNNSFIVIASPSGAIHSGAMKVKVERHHNRAAVGGTGDVKVGGNYASATQANLKVQQQGYHHVLWLDPYRREIIEELSGMNFFAVINGQLHTPELSGSILPGITRDSIIQLARSLGMAVIERKMPIDELLNDIAANNCSELFACGTAAILTPISVINDGTGSHDGKGKDFILSDGDVTLLLREKLLAIQESRTKDTFGWNYVVADKGKYTNSATTEKLTVNTSD